MARTDCGVFLSRAEGWNLEAIEMMALGKPIIITNYSAHTEFCSANNASLVEINEVEEAYDGIWFHGQGSWAALNNEVKEQTINHMRKVCGKSIYNSNGVVTAQHHSWENTANRLLNGINLNE
jgi:hypothetical protein